MTTENLLSNIANPNIDPDLGLCLLPQIFKEFLTEKDKLKLRSKKFKPVIIEYLKKNKDTTTSELSDLIGLSYEDTFYILKELEKEHKIVVF